MLLFNVYNIYIVYLFVSCIGIVVYLSSILQYTCVVCSWGGKAKIIWRVGLALMNAERGRCQTSDVAKLINKKYVNSKCCILFFYALLWNYWRIKYRISTTLVK